MSKLRVSDALIRLLMCLLSLWQFYADANEAESWLNERLALVGTNDYGVDEPSAQALLHRHKDLEGEINAYTGDIQSLNTQADKLIKAGISTLEVPFFSFLVRGRYCVMACCWCQCRI